MRFVVVGAGSIGGALGASLLEAGDEVTFVARGATLAALRERPLRVELPSRAIELDVDVVAPGAARTGPDDVVLLCVKSQDTLGALDALTPGLAPGAAVVCVQNGLANEELALRYAADVYGAGIICPADLVEPGLVRVFCEPTGLVELGRYPEGIDARGLAIAEAFTRAGFDTVARERVMPWKATKLLVNVTNAVEALCGTKAREGELGRLARAEAEQVLTTAGVELAGDAGDAERRASLERLPVNGTTRMGASTWQSVARGAAVETDWLNGEVVLLGRRHGIATPVNELLQREMWQLHARGAAPGSVDQDVLLAQL